MSKLDGAIGDDRNTTSPEQLKLALTSFCDSFLGETQPDEPVTGGAAYERGWSLAKILITFGPSIASVDENAAQAFREAANRLGDLYRVGTESVRRCVVDAILEHVFESPSLIPFFDSWRRDPVLRQAFDEATQWAEQLQKVRSLLEQLGPMVGSRLREIGALDIQVWPFDIGSDILMFEWSGWQRPGQSHLDVECADDLVAAVVAGYSPASEQVERYVDYVTNPENWSEAEHLEGDFYVTIPLEL
ncbi:MAG: hypothetical protein HC897_17150 [Thermoanaerobaculia bacterium]|nr:hypothetical protein [Thermoanaerobaculia bacterium]